MTTSNMVPSEIAAVVGVIDPDVTAAGAVSTDWASAADFESMLATVLAGTLGTNATVNAKLEQATDASGTGVKDIAGKAITELTDAGADSDKQALINVRAEELDIDNDFTHVRLTVTVGVATSDIAGTLMGFGARLGPASNRDLASVDEIVT